MTEAQGWTLLALVGVLLSVIGGLIVHQFALMRSYLNARFVGLETSIEAASVPSTSGSTISTGTCRR